MPHTSFPPCVRIGYNADPAAGAGSLVKGPKLDILLQFFAYGIPFAAIGFDARRIPPARGEQSSLSDAGGES